MARLGQHFLRDRSVAERMVELAEIRRDDVVLEVGTGTGELTEAIARTGCRVVTVEIDPVLAEVARRRLSGYGNVEVIHADALRVELPEFNKVLSSPPYYISTKLLRWLATRALPERAVLLLQREFAEKLVAEPGSRKYVLTSLLVRSAFEVRIAFDVGRKAFSPPPKVTSSVVALSRRSGEVYPDWFVEVLAKAFTTRRRLLRGALARVSVPCPPDLSGLRVCELDPDLARRLLEAIQESRRPHQLA
ncbi:MAG: 16S rRNA (adenine(1518)-N(6)/adenine(1519)-N(6))-dimethyltransferase RsmA [Thaumarchaeota archaeon]|nr:16S rRNA (adenine(1518)-N(6)/adenine(1519)-N(6))-dimethyltransferase RsmA [Candidatus Calditenuaceae archaeon]MCX8203625.1 16S rRNA (adenine(1518)-N(6)/adenine(1519)-N(6))-dimethyltransferase RsmA [Nitrososphaeria archaeon]MDW8043480.1 16S rRNA (adenine(1518)-N(6)/adenine(1519)-N(6))-dimethyltransferase RsmA [Nitrososphaerota archaeon]